MTAVRVMELVGESEHNWESAATSAVSQAARTVNNITGVEILNWTADINDGHVVKYKANVKIAYVE